MISTVKRVILIVCDSVGIGSLPDAVQYGDEGSHTLGHIFEQYPQINIPYLLQLGLGNIDVKGKLPTTSKPLAAYGRASELSAGKDTTTGHWEITGAVLEKPFPTFPKGFPDDFITEYQKAIGTNVLGNYSASGTEIIEKLGDEHLNTGFPIVYTSADSVFQIAAHEDIIPLETLYKYCQIAREMLNGDMEVGRVIARPFRGESGHFVRTAYRKDFAILPPYNVLDAIVDNGMEVYGIGKIFDIFAGKGITRQAKTKDNNEGIQATIDAIKEDTSGLVFVNLVDFDMHYGHRRDVVGYAQCLEAFDKEIPNIIGALKPNDLLIITADHGNDPTWHGTDHTREYIPLLNIGPSIRKGVDLGVRNSFSDIAATIASALGIDFNCKGNSYWHEICTLS